MLLPSITASHPRPLDFPSPPPTPLTRPACTQPPRTNLFSLCFLSSAPVFPPHPHRQLLSRHFHLRPKKSKDKLMSSSVVLMTVKWERVAQLEGDELPSLGAAHCPPLPLLCPLHTNSLHLPKTRGSTWSPTISKAYTCPKWWAAWL